MEKPWNEPMPSTELERFKNLDDIQVVFDVGARTSLDYLTIFPNAEYHLFEPHPPFHEWLQQECKDKPNIRVNPYALGNIDGTLKYDLLSQSFMKGTGELLPVKTLNWYIKQNNIKRIDFLKIDTEKWDYLVLQGGTKAIGMARYIQYETWNEQENNVMVDLLEDKYTLEDIGGRNMLCKLKQ